MLYRPARWPEGKGHVFLHVFIGHVTGNCLWMSPPPPPQYLAERSERDLTDVLTLIWRFVLLQAGVGLVSHALLAYCPSVMWHRVEKTWKSRPAGSGGDSGLCALLMTIPEKTAFLNCESGLKRLILDTCNSVRMLWAKAADSSGVWYLTCLMLPALLDILIHVRGSAYIPYINSVNTLPRPADDEGCY